MWVADLKIGLLTSRNMRMYILPNDPTDDNDKVLLIKINN